MGTLHDAPVDVETQRGAVAGYIACVPERAADCMRGLPVVNDIQIVARRLLEYYIWSGLIQDVVRFEYLDNVFGGVASEGHDKLIKEVLLQSHITNLCTQKTAPTLYLFHRHLSLLHLWISVLNFRLIGVELNMLTIYM